jgi:hypothetical protein
MRCLQVHPEFCRNTKAPRQAQRRIRSDGTFAAKDLRDPIGWHRDITCKRTRGKAQGPQEFLLQHFTWRHQGQSLTFHLCGQLGLASGNIGPADRYGFARHLTSP